MSLDDISARERAALDALENRTVEIIEAAQRLDDRRLEQQRALLSTVRTTITTVDDVLAPLEEIRTLMRARSPPQAHPLAAKLKAKQDAAGVSIRDLIANAMVYEETGRHVPAYAALVSACRMFEAIYPAMPVAEPPQATAGPKRPKPTALDRAMAAVREHPEKSLRAIAAEIHVDKETVRTARKKIETATGDSPLDSPPAR